MQGEKKPVYLERENGIFGGKKQGYFTSLHTDDDNRSREDCYLCANCTGMYVLTDPFTTFLPGGRNDFYLQYVYGGEMDVELDGAVQRMAPGDAIVYYPHTRYKYWLHKNEDGVGAVQYYWLHFTGYGAKELMHKCGIPNKTLLHVGTQCGLEAEFEKLFGDFVERDACFEVITASHILSLCVTLFRSGALQQGRPGAGDSRVYNAVAYIHRNYPNKISVEELAKAQFLSVSRFRSLFKETTGYSPAEYITLLRMGAARQLLAQSQFSMGEISEMVGCSDRLYFSRLFKLKTGLSPAQYRRQAIEQQRTAARETQAVKDIENG